MANMRHPEKRVISASVRESDYIKFKKLATSKKATLSGAIEEVIKLATSNVTLTEEEKKAVTATIEKRQLLRLKK